MRRPTYAPAKARAVRRLLIGHGLVDVPEPENSHLRVGGMHLWVSGTRLNARMTPGQALDILGPKGVLVRCVDPEIERAIVEMRLEDYADLMNRRGK